MPRVAANTAVPMQMDVKPKPDWLNKIQSGEIKKKISNEVLKRRRNHRLANLLKPKAPINVLIELTKQGEVTFEKPISDQVSRLIKVSASYDAKTFEGVGPTKNIAKNICSEAILQYIAFKACEKDAQREDIVRGSHGEEETPWTALASVALFKMFNDWQAQGAVLPAVLMSGKGAPGAAPGATDMTGDVQMKEANGAPKAKKSAKPRAEKTLPEDAATRHPVSMLHEMCGTMDYETVSEGITPNIVYHMSVLVKDQKFTGSAKTKKEAKKNCAAEVMRNIFGVNYPPEIKTE
jgi:hypothetical protein